MSMRRLFERRLAGWLVVLLLAAQWATASYACPRFAPVDPAASTMPEMPGCDGSMSPAMDPEQPQLCKAHCEHGDQAVAQPVPFDPPTPMPLVWAVLDWHAQALRPPSRLAGLLHPPPPDRPAAPPIYLAFRVLRN